MKSLALGLLRLYKRWISPAFPPSCRYVPTCSEYAMEAVERYGAWAFDNPKYVILNAALGGAFPRAMNGVSSPYPGIPPSTVDSIAGDKIRMLVDWVRVTKH